MAGLDVRMMPARHDLVWLSGAGWEAVKREMRDATDAQPCGALPRSSRLAVIERWSAAGWPATVRRHDAQAMPDQICLGITPPHDGKGESGARMRIALHCQWTDVTRVTRPLDLEAASAAVPEQWQTAYRQLLDDTRGLDLRVFGSLALQALTTCPYLTERSDIDLAFYPKEWSELKAGVAIFEAAREHLPLDGEIVFPSGRAVAWKEWSGLAAQGPSARVLVKGMHEVGLRAMAELLDEFAERPCRR